MESVASAQSRHAFGTEGGSTRPTTSAQAHQGRDDNAKQNAHESYLVPGLKMSSEDVGRICSSCCSPLTGFAIQRFLNGDAGYLARFSKTSLATGIAEKTLGQPT